MNNYANAQHLASHGRGNDTQLVHMTPGELKGLQALALAHGGSLTINPNTGLPEAGFLEQILPMVVGAGLTIASGGALTPLMAAGITGAGYGLATGSVEKGLMAGLGAYGGAGLTTSLAGLGAEAGMAASEKLATEGFKTANEEAIKSSLGNQAMDASRGMVEPQAAQTLETAQKFINPNNFPGLSPETLEASRSGLSEAVKNGSTPEQYMGSLGRASATLGAPASAGTTLSNVGTGLKEVGSSLPAAGSFVANNVGPIASLALPALAQSGQQAARPTGYQEDEYDRRLKGYKLSPDYQPYVAPRPNPYYRPTYAAMGGIMNSDAPHSFDDEAGSDDVGMAAGGIGMASGGIARYASKGQVNVLQDYLDRQEGEENKQKHLSTNPSSYFPDVGIFRDTDVDTAKKDALTATMIRLGKAGKAAGIKPVALPKTSIKGLGDVSGATPEIEEAAGGGVMGYNLGGYSDGGRMLKGPGDGMSDSIPASIAGKQPARLADGEFVVPADVVSHLGNGSTDAGAKKLYGMMDKIRHARTGKKKQAPKVNVDKYLPGNKKASGGIAGYAEGGVVGYADGGDIAALYDSVLGRKPDAGGAAYYSNLLASGTPIEQIRASMAASPEAKTYQTNQVQQIFNDQLGRTAEQTAVDFYTKALASGQSLADVSKGIAQSLEGQKLDKQGITSVYRQALGRNPEPEGQQYWLSVAQSEGLTTNQLKDRITAAAAAEQTARNIAPGTKFTQMQLDALGSDPYGGYYSEKSIYDVAPDAQNVSTIGNRQVQFTTPVTQQAVVSQFINGIYTAKQGLDVLNTPQAMAGLNLALANGSLSTKDYDNLVKQLDNSKTPAEVRAALSTPKAYVILDAAYGQQIGEAANLAEAQREAALRQSVLTGIDPGYYLSNQVLTDAYKKAEVSTPFQYDFYKDVDTRDTTSNLLTKDNFSNKKNELVDATRANPYRVLYDPLNPNNPNNLTLANRFATRDPYSDEGLKLLYGQMMGQYGTPNPNQVNPATQPYIGSTYKPPVPQRLLDEQNAKAAYDAKVAADKLAYENAPLSAENFDETDYRTRYPDAFPGTGRAYQHYLEANANGDIRTANKLPFTAKPYTAAPLFGPGSSDTATTNTTTTKATTAAPVADPSAPVNNIVGIGNKAGGLTAIDHKKRAKTKPRKGLLAA